jgi:hypothetical protein
MAIEFVGGAIAERLATGIFDPSFDMPLDSGLTGGIASSVEDGDYVVAVFATGSTADRTLYIGDGTDPYPLLGSELYANDTLDVNLRVGAKFVDGDTIVEFGPTGSTSDPGVTALYVFRGVDPVTPLDVSVVTATGTNSGLANPPAITPITSGAFIVALGAGHLSGNIGNPANFSSSDLTDFFQEYHPETNDITLGIGHKPDWVSGSFNPAAFTNSLSDSTSYSWAAMTIALRPAVGGNIKVWNGTAWVAKPVKVWNGSAWVAKPVKRWNGTAWVTTTY